MLTQLDNLYSSIDVYKGEDALQFDLFAEERNGVELGVILYIDVPLCRLNSQL